MKIGALKGQKTRRPKYLFRVKVKYNRKNQEIRQNWENIRFFAAYPDKQTLIRIKPLQPP